VPTATQQTVATRATSLKISVAKYKNLELSPEGLINEIGRNGFFRCIWSIG
jgi:hypothetical protein